MEKRTLNDVDDAAASCQHYQHHRGPFLPLQASGLPARSWPGNPGLFVTAVLRCAALRTSRES